MNILFVTPFYAPQTGGVATYIDNLKRALERQGHYVYVLRAGESDSISECSQCGDTHIFEFYMRGPWFPKTPLKGILAFLVYLVPTLFKLAAFIRLKQIQLVFLQYPLAWMLYFRLLHSLVSVRTIVDLHGDDVLSLHLNSRIEQWIVRGLVQRADWVLAHSESLLARAVTIIGGLEKKSSCLPLGVDCQRLRLQANGQKQERLIPEGPYVLTVAKLFGRKGLDVLLMAVKTLASESHGYKFVIVGDGPEERGLRELTAHLKIEKHVNFYGEALVEDIPVLIQNCAFVVLPSRSEPFGIVLLEAMTFGKAIVATSVGGIQKLLRTAITDSLFPLRMFNFWLRKFGCCCEI